MKFYSTNNPDHKVSIKKALFKSLAPDNGLYMPEIIPLLDEKFLSNLPRFSFQEICLHMASQFLSNDVEFSKLKNIIDKSINFDAPLIKLNKRIHILELWHGPTLAFKDFGARFMAHLMGHFIEKSSNPLHILVATSGDTGSAIANSFLGVDGIHVYILYPKNRVTKIQEHQFTTLGSNITALEVEGSFDDCQKLVKTAFLDEALNESLHLTSANSINIGRLIAQTFYYVYAFSQLTNPKNVVMSVPSGNFGNLTAGIISKKMGLPVKKFIASTNANKIVPEYLITGDFSPRSSIQTISNAMDVGNPSNFERLLNLCDHSHEKIQEEMVGYYFNDEETKLSIQKVYSEFNYLMDPHGAVGYTGLNNYLKKDKSVTGIFLGTAHPAKFYHVVNNLMENQIKLPKKLKSFLNKTKKTTSLGNSFDELKSLLMEAK